VKQEDRQAVSDQSLPEFDDVKDGLGSHALAQVPVYGRSTTSLL
jgi:hypothetical protein